MLILFDGDIVCLFDNNLFALLLFEGICHSNSKNEQISLQRATLRAGLQNRNPTTSGAGRCMKVNPYI
jgi:hypothetical protein